MNSSSLAALAAPYLERFACGHLLALDLGGFAIDVHSNDKPLIQWLTSYFRDFLRASGSLAQCHVFAVECPAPSLPLAYTAKEPEPGKEKIKEEWADLEDGRVVRKRLTGMIFLFGQGRNLALGPCRENPNQVVNFINNRFIEHKLNQGCLLGHAAGVALHGRGLALAGFSGMGKSTLALHMMNLGLDFISNDRLLISREPKGLAMYGVAKMPRVNPGTVLNNPSLTGVMGPEERREFSLLSARELWSLEHKYDAIIEECFGPGRFRIAADMAALAILNWQREGCALRVEQVDIASRRDLLQAFMKSAGLFYDGTQAPDVPEASEEAYAGMLAGCAVLEVTGGADFLKASEILAGRLVAA